MVSGSIASIYVNVSDLIIESVVVCISENAVFSDALHTRRGSQRSPGSSLGWVSLSHTWQRWKVPPFLLTRMHGLLL